MANTTLKTRLVIRNDTAANWAAANPVLLKSEFGYCTDEKYLKVGDGVTHWTGLSPFKPDTSIHKDHAPTDIEAAACNAETLWYNTSSGEVYIITSFFEPPNRSAKVLTDKNIGDYNYMPSTLFAKDAGAGQGTGYVDKALRADRLTTARTLALSGDVTGSQSFDGSGNVTLAATLRSSGVTAGTYTKVTVDAKGIITSAAALIAADVPVLPASKISGFGTAAAKNTGTAAGQVPLLEGGGKLPESVLPALAITDTFEAASQAAMLALGVQKGDVCVRTDENKSYILAGTGDPKVLANWKWLRTPTDAVLSVNGKTGAVSLRTNDVPEGGTNLYFTAARVLDVLGDANNTFILDGGNA